VSSSRRGFLIGGGVGGFAVAASSAATLDAGEDQAWLQAILERYDRFGVKASGGPGDGACGEWLETLLAQWGYACTRQTFEAPWFEVARATLSSGETQALVAPQAIVEPTGPGGVKGPLRLASDHGDLAGSIAVIVLPYKRWASLSDPEVARPLTDAFDRKAAAAVLVTTGPTGEAIALNVTAEKPGLKQPVAILAPKDARTFLIGAAVGRSGTLIVDGEGGRRSAFNLIARLDRKAPKTLILSTPRSGWFGCAAERGSGLAVWLFLARWLAGADHGVNLELIATSGHEYDYLGGAHYLSTAPGPDQTRLWVHIGASAAARDWHEFGPGLRALPSADSQRVLSATQDIVGKVRTAFQGVSGLEATYVADRMSVGGELSNVLAAGYRSLIGLYGAHRYFHTQHDDLRCASGHLVEPVALGFRKALTACLAA